MVGLFDSLIVFISTLIAVIMLGIAAGFSPVLYVAQAATVAKRKKTLHQTMALVLGVVAALLTLNVLFQIINIETLLRLIDTTVRAIIISVAFNVMFGLILIGIGVWYLRRKAPIGGESFTPNNVKQGGKLSAIFTLGFLRTALSVSGLTATYIAGNTIAATSFIWIEQVIYTVIFLGAATAPFFAIWLLAEKGLPILPQLYKRTLAFVHGVNYRSALGYGSIIFGTAVVVLNIMLGLLY